MCVVDQTPTSADIHNSYEFPEPISHTNFGRRRKNQQDKPFSDILPFCWSVDALSLESIKCGNNRETSQIQFGFSFATKGKGVRSSHDQRPIYKSNEKCRRLHSANYETEACCEYSIVDLRNRMLCIGNFTAPMRQWLRLTTTGTKTMHATKPKDTNTQKTEFV